MESAVLSSGDKTLQEFFKVFLLSTGSSQLQIPKSFTKFFNGITPCKATLIDHDKHSWDIFLEKIEGRLIFKNGWQQFAREKGLEDGDFLVFQYDGRSTFSVKIFSKTGCRKVAAPASCEKNVPIVILDEDSNQSCSKLQRLRKRKCSATNLKINEKLVVEGPSEGACSKSKRANEKKPNLTKCVPFQKPHFQMYFSHWRMNRVEIPKAALKKLNIKMIPKMNLRAENDKIWPVAIITSGKGRHFFGDGWYDFRVNNNIQEGCRCEFQFVISTENIANELLVRIHPPSEVQK